MGSFSTLPEFVRNFLSPLQNRDLKEVDFELRPDEGPT
jgi:hypothetical protein